MIFHQSPGLTLHHGDVIDCLRALPDGAVP